jgi:hypothetical protein
MSKTDDTYDKIERSLFKDIEDATLSLTVREQEIRKRMMLSVSKKMDSPLIEDSQMVEFLMHGCGGLTAPVSQSQAYRDIGMINRLVGNIRLAAKDWYRYMIIEGAKKAYQIAIDSGDAKGAAANLDKIGKYTRSDKDDNKFDYDKMIPPSFEPSDDITLLEGIEPIADLEERRKELRQLARGMVKSKAVDAEIITDQEKET